MKRYTLLLILFGVSITLLSQTFSGRITSENGTPIPYASVYIHERMFGFTSDDQGRFQTTLSPGHYTCDVSSLGFIQKQLSFDLSDKDLRMGIILQERVYQLSGVNITRGKEDPAYAVMRKAIAYAPFYRDRVTTYVADCYLKGTGRINKIPSILKISKKVREESKLVLNKLFVLESHTKVDFIAPSTYHQQVKAYSNSFPDAFEVTNGLSVNTINLYAPSLFGKISPLSSGSFSYYRFYLDECFSNGGHLVNKIRFTPKKQSPQLFSGYLYIVEDLWSVSDADLHLNSGPLIAKIRITCKEVQPTVFLVTSFSMNCRMDYMGMSADANYFSSVKYDQLSVNRLNIPIPLLRDSTSAVTVSTTKQQLNILTKIGKLSAKEQLTTKESYRLAKLLNKTDLQEFDTVRTHKFDRTQEERNIISQFDSLAAKRDSFYWTSVRSVPLSLQERMSYAHKDSITWISRNDSVRKNVNKGGVLGTASSLLLLGRTFESINKQSGLKLYAFNSYLPEYNFVDGLWVGGKLTGFITFGNQSKLELTPSVYYTSARRRAVGQLVSSFSYLPLRSGLFQVKGGVLSTDYNEESGIARSINSFTSLFFARNDSKFYEKRFVEVTNRIEVANGLLFDMAVQFAKRKELINAVNYSLFNKRSSDNTPYNTSYIPMSVHQTVRMSASLVYTPAHYYVVRKDKKIYSNSVYPTFTLRYDQAFALSGEAFSPSYNRIELSVRQSTRFTLFDSFDYFLQAGTFWNRKNVHFPDFKHFESSSFPIVGHSFNAGVSLLRNYQLSTDNHWFQGNVNYKSSYLLMKNLPLLQDKPFDEAFHLRSIMRAKQPIYCEIGYSMGFLNLFRVGVFVGFEKIKYRSAGFSISIPLSDI